MGEGTIAGDKLFKLCGTTVANYHASLFIVLTISSKGLYFTFYIFTYYKCVQRNEGVICHIRDFISFRSLSVGNFVCSEKITWIVLSGVEENAVGEEPRSQRSWPRSIIMIVRVWSLQ